CCGTILTSASLATPVFLVHHGEFLSAHGTSCGVTGPHVTSLLRSQAGTGASLSMRGRNRCLFDAFAVVIRFATRYASGSDPPKRVGDTLTHAVSAAPQ